MTLSENVHRVVELSQRIIVEKSVIQTYEEIKHNLKTTEICVESTRTVSNSSAASDGSVVHDEEDINCEHNKNGDISDNGDECVLDDSCHTLNGECETQLNGSEALSSLSKQESMIQRPTKPKSEMDFCVPYNIINNYFSVGVVSIIFV